MDKKMAIKGIAQVLALWIVLETAYIVAIAAYDTTVFGWIDLRKATLHKVLLVPSFQTLLLCLAFACRAVYRRLRKKA
ncbi:MAG: hypothetical protein E4H15_04265 [Syntrophobacterales bacterium]|nr:MAG: hypothetical protein E4H15_04265 [Syntrophobacterales bacterium]